MTKKHHESLNALQDNRMLTYMKRLFISRKVAPESIFHSLAAQFPELEIQGESLLEFSPIAFDAVPDADWIFFTSSTAVRFFFSRAEALQTGFPENVRWAALGEGTAQTLASFGKEPDFTGNGRPDHAGPAFAAQCIGQRVLFPQAEQSRKSIHPYLGPKTMIMDLTVYANRIRPSFCIPEPDLVILTSPMNAKAFFSVYPVKAHQRVIAIGESTRKELIRLGVHQVFLPAKPSESALAQLAWDLLNQSIAAT